MLSIKKIKWYKIASEEFELNFGSNNLLQINVSGKAICIAKTGETLYACAQKCPHAGGTLADGFIDALGNVVCPLHRYKFNLQNGKDVSGEGYYLKTFPVQQTKEGIYVGIDESGISF